MCFSNYSDKKVIINASDCNALIDFLKKMSRTPKLILYYKIDFPVSITYKST